VTAFGLIHLGRVMTMSSSTVAEGPVEELKRWLLHDWKGSLRPDDVTPLRGEDADGREAWYLLLTLPEPDRETWDPDDLAELRRAIRDKALEVGLAYPWYVVPRTGHEERVEDELDLPDDVS
jgi:hypothetical protein